MNLYSIYRYIYIYIYIYIFIYLFNLNQTCITEVHRVYNNYDEQQLNENENGI